VTASPASFLRVKALLASSSQEWLCKPKAQRGLSVNETPTLATHRIVFPRIDR
jgi:hypothetical protein